LTALPAVAQYDEGDPQVKKTAWLLAALAFAAVALVSPASARKEASTRKAAVKHFDPALGVKLARLLDQITTHRNETWRWQKLMQRPRTRYAGSAVHVRSLAYSQWVRDLWWKRAQRAKTQALNPPHRREWLCIHHYEGAWDDPNAPYYGGLQMDQTFQAMYGARLLRAKGTADHWTPLEQMWVAERAYKTRGFWPWPNTARACGLI
jgi:hypothetical protein